MNETPQISARHGDQINQNAHSGSWHLDLGSQLLTCSDEACRVLGRKYAIACGPPLAHTPGLAMAIPARPPPAEGSDGAEAAGAPPDADLEAFPPYLWMPQTN